MGAALPVAVVTMAGAVMEGVDDGGNGNGSGCSGNSDDGSRMVVVADEDNNTMGTYLVHMSIMNQELTAKSGVQYIFEENVYGDHA